MFWRVQSYRENNHVNVQYQKLHGALFLLCSQQSQQYQAACLDRSVPSALTSGLAELLWHKQQEKRASSIQTESVAELELTQASDSADTWLT